MERSLAIERPPPRSSLPDRARRRSTRSRRMRGLHASSHRASTARVVIVLTDGESHAVSNSAPGQPLSCGRLRSGSSSSSSGAEDEQCLHAGRAGAAVPRRSVRARDARSARGVDARRASTRRTRSAPRRARTRRSSAAGRPSVEGRTPERCALAPYLAVVAAVPVRPPPVAPRPLSSYSSGNHISTASGSRSSMYEIARLASHRSAAEGSPRRARARTASSPRLGPALLAGPRAPEPAESERGAVDVARVLVGTSPRRSPDRCSDGRLVGAVCPRPRRQRNRCVFAVFSPCRESASHSPNEIGFVVIEAMILHLTMATEASGSTRSWPARQPTRQLARRTAASALVKIGRRPLGWREYMRKRSTLACWRARLAIVASLVVGPAATAGLGRRRRRGRSCSFTTRSRRTFARTWVE